MTRFIEKVRREGELILLAMDQGLTLLKLKLEATLAVEQNLLPVVLSQASLLAYVFLQRGGRNCTPFR